MFSQLYSSHQNSLRSELSSQSRIEAIHSNAIAVLSQKNQEIEKYKIEIDESEKELTRLKSILESLQANDESKNQNSSDSNNDSKEKSNEDKLFLDMENVDDIEEVKARYQEEIEETKSKYSNEIGTLQIYFSRSLKEAERIAEQHAETVYLEKKAELDETLRQIDLIESANEENQFRLTASRIQKMQQEKTNSMLNSLKIDKLSQELSDLTSLSRTELRDVKIKVDECFVTAEIQQKDHENEMRRLTDELESREKLFSRHYATVVQSYEAEKQRLSEQLQQSTQKIAELRKSYKNMTTQNEQQEKQLYNDIQKLKSSLSVSIKGRDQASSMIQSNVLKQQHFQREIKQIENDIAMVDKEIQEIQVENAQLKIEMNRIDSRKKQSL